MAPTLPVPKALTYITQGENLLVLRQPDSLDARIQVPGGSIEPGEAPEAAALREAEEETGLSGLRLVAFLGSVPYTPKVHIGPPHQRHFFHLIHAGAVQESWDHYEQSPSEGGPPVLFRLTWEPLRTVRLDWEMDAFLDALRRNFPAQH